MAAAQPSCTAAAASAASAASAPTAPTAAVVGSGRVRPRDEEGTHHHLFTQRLLKTYETSYALIGSYHGRNVATRISDARGTDLTTPDAYKERILEARFAMGADDGQYLRSNVMPLQSARDDDDDALAGHLNLEIELAGRAGVLEAMLQHVGKQRNDENAKLKEQLSVIGWLLSIKEIQEFVFTHLRDLHLDKAADIVRAFSQVVTGATSEVAYGNLLTSASPGAVGDIIEAIILVLTAGMQVVDAQLDVTIGTDGTGTARVADSIDRLARAAKESRPMYDSDFVPASTARRRAAEVQRVAAATAAFPALQAHHIYAIFGPEAEEQDIGMAGAPGVASALIALMVGAFASNPALPPPQAQRQVFAQTVAILKQKPGALENPVAMAYLSQEVRENKIGEDGLRILGQIARDEQQPESVRASASAALEKWDVGDNGDAAQERDIGQQVAFLQSEETLNAIKSQKDQLILVPTDHPIRDPASENDGEDLVPTIADFFEISQMQARTVLERYHSIVVGSAPPPLEKPLPPSSPQLSEDPEVRKERESDQANRTRAEPQRTESDKANRTRAEPQRTEPQRTEPPQSKPIPPSSPIPAAPDDVLVVDTPPNGVVLDRPNITPVDPNQAGPSPPAAASEGQVEPSTGAVILGIFAQLAESGLLAAALAKFGGGDGGDDADDARGTVANDVCELPSADACNGGDCSMELDGLCAALSQLREDGGLTRSVAEQVLRSPGISPFWKIAKDRVLQRTASPDENDWWRRAIWSGQIPDPANQLATLRQTLDQFDNLCTKLQKDLVNEQSSEQDRALAYALVRGLCGERGPHMFPGDYPTKLAYSLPTVNCPTDVLKKAADNARKRASSDAAAPLFSGPLSAIVAELSFCSEKERPVRDFVKGARRVSVPTEDRARLVMWAPVKLAQAAREPDGAIPRRPTTRVPVVRDNSVDKLIAHAAVLEHLVDYFNARTETTRNGARRLAMACAAAAKIKQLQSMSAIVKHQEEVGSGQMLCPPVLKTDRASVNHFFVTRPVVRCPNGSVLYPCDAGLASFRRDTKISDTLTEEAELGPEGANLAFTEAEGQVGSTGARTIVDRGQATLGMRNALSKVTDDGDVTLDTACSLYVAAAPGKSAPVGVRDIRVLRPRVFDINNFPDKPEFASIDAIKEAVENVSMQAKRSMKLQSEYAHVQALLEQEEHDRKKRAENPCLFDDANAAARERREAVWNDSLREASIAADRLYAFVRQLSGTISENVDAVCQIDEGMLVRQQQQIRERRTRAADQAAREHMQLVRNVFASILRESGLSFGIGDIQPDGDVGQLKIVSNSLRKQASELTQQPGSSDGFFSNAVRLEQLLSKGTGEMTLTDLFDRLREAGNALQNAALTTGAVDGLTGPGASLDFLSAPRNSLVLRYKPEALAAMRQAFDTFQREMRNRHGPMHRGITAYELIEGRDEALQSAFAQFSAHMLVHSRMYSSSTAMYVAAWPAAANAQQLKISLNRLVNVACDYLAYAGKPNFLGDGGRLAYFGGGRGPPMHQRPTIPMVPKGLWAIDFYGGRR